jgi:hypothetical protein
MVEIVPTVLPDSRIIRTYTKDYAETDIESEEEAQLEMEKGDEKDVEISSISTRLEQNQLYVDQQITPPSSARLQKAAKAKTGKKIPSFISGYVNGQPIYTQIRVVPQEIVAGIEHEIAEQEKKEHQRKQAS